MVLSTDLEVGRISTVADPEIMNSVVEDNASSSFIANAHNDLYAFYTGKGGLFKKNLSQ